MNIKQKESGVEIRRYAVGANDAQTCTELQAKPLCSTPYSAVNAKLRKFGGIFRRGEDVVPMQGAHEHEAKVIGS